MYDEIVNAILRRREEIAQTVVQFPLQDYPAYRQQCGVVEGLQYALNVIADIRSGHEDSN